MARIVPMWVPFRIEIIHVSGVLEPLGAVGIWIPAVTRLAGLCLVIMLIGILPSNVSAALNRVRFGGHETGPVCLLARAPFQLPVVGWIYWAAGQEWSRSLRDFRWSRLPRGAPDDPSSTECRRAIRTALAARRRSVADPFIQGWRSW